MELRIMAEHMKETASVLRGFIFFGAAAGLLPVIRSVSRRVKSAGRRKRR
jgi:hypothetical protein